MKKFISLFIIIGFYANLSYGQSIKIDALLGSKGLFSKFKPKVEAVNSIQMIKISTL